MAGAEETLQGVCDKGDIMIGDDWMEMHDRYSGVTTGLEAPGNVSKWVTFRKKERKKESKIETEKSGWAPFTSWAPGVLPVQPPCSDAHG